MGANIYFGNKATKMKINVLHCKTALYEVQNSQKKKKKKQREGRKRDTRRSTQTTDRLRDRPGSPLFTLHVLKKHFSSFAPFMVNFRSTSVDYNFGFVFAFVLTPTGAALASSAPLPEAIGHGTFRSLSGGDPQSLARGDRSLRRGEGSVLRLFAASTTQPGPLFAPVQVLHGQEGNVQKCETVSIEEAGRVGMGGRDGWSRG